MTVLSGRLPTTWLERAHTGRAGDEHTLHSHDQIDATVQLIAQSIHQAKSLGVD